MLPNVIASEIRAIISRSTSSPRVEDYDDGRGAKLLSLGNRFVRNVKRSIRRDFFA
jgi:hypothetical protein